MTVRHTIVFAEPDSTGALSYTCVPPSTDDHAVALAATFKNAGVKVARIERSEVTVISTPSTAVGRAPFADFVKEARNV